MHHKALLLIGAVVLFSSLPGKALSQGSIPLYAWMPWAGDRLWIDTSANMGYLVHSDGSSTAFPVATGQRRLVRYIGLTYFAATPEKSWTVELVDIKGDRVTFGSTGRFLRLFEQDGDRTHYGIHGHRDAAAMLEGDMRYRSMGCIIVSEDVLNILERTFIETGPFPVTTAGTTMALPEFMAVR